MLISICLSLIHISKNATVEISYIGYTTQTVSVAGKSDLKVTLQEDNKGLDEVVVVGYGVQRKSDVTGALAHLDSKDLTAMPVKDALELSLIHILYQSRYCRSCLPPASGDCCR